MEFSEKHLNQFFQYLTQKVNPNNDILEFIINSWVSLFDYMKNPKKWDMGIAWYLNQFCAINDINDIDAEEIFYQEFIKQLPIYFETTIPFDEKEYKICSENEENCYEIYNCDYFTNMFLWYKNKYFK